MEQEVQAAGNEPIAEPDFEAAAVADVAAAGDTLATAQGPFRIFGSDGSERGPFADLERAQGFAAALTENHDGVTFEVWDIAGNVQS